MLGIVDRMGLEEDEAIEHRLLTNSIENAQKKVEGKNFGIRKHVLQYDDVMNKQREVIYEERRKVLEGENMRDHVFGLVDNIIDRAIEIYTADARYPEEWDLDGLKDYLGNIFLPPKMFSLMDTEDLTFGTLKQQLVDMAGDIYEKKEQDIGLERMREIERIILLQVVDMKWMDHIDAMDQLRQGIGLRAIGQEDPVRAYQVEGFDMFQDMVNSIQEDTVRYLFSIEKEAVVEKKQVAKSAAVEPESMGGGNTPVKKKSKVGRNDPCPCGSGKKYKRCCGV